LSLTGCGTYASCDKCVLDPNCGWCRNQGLGDLAVGTSFFPARCILGMSANLSSPLCRTMRSGNSNTTAKSNMSILPIQ
jgi:hypothetical protein